MSSLKAIRTRIRSVKSTQQITRAMKMVAAARLRRAQEAVLSARPYSKAMKGVLDSVASRAALARHPLLQQREIKRIEVLAITSDRGLCGGFNGAIERRVRGFALENEGRVEKITLRTIGRKGHDFFRRRGREIRKNYPGLLSNLKFSAAQEIARELADLFLSGEIDAVMLVYNEFVSAVTQEVRVVQLLPIENPELSAPAPGAVLPVEYEYEPDAKAILEDLLPRYLANNVWQALLESLAAENAARMTAMENATKNAADMISKLTLQFNRTRQAMITKELVEIVSGAEALQ